MINIIDKSKCSGCHACASICPQNCIEMKVDDEGFWYPKINASTCINCGLCEKACPIIHNKHNLIKRTPDTYAAFNKNEDIRMNSSSGGMFTLIAEHIVNQNGVVFGACFDKEFNVIHNFVETIYDLHKFRGSKYVQSKIGDTYKKAKNFLDSGRLVLFTGTPCQIGGLYSYLRKDYDNLLTQDIICHGVPSPKAWKKYIDFREDIDKQKPTNIYFRNKDRGWKQFSMKFTYSENSYCETLRGDQMMKAFLKNRCLRPSCYNCSFKNINRQSDITLADYWGISNVHPEMDDDKGTSLLILNSDKGKAIFEQIKDNTLHLKSDLNIAVKYNSAMIKSVANNKYRDKFMNNLDKYEFDKLVKKYCEPAFSSKCIRLAFRVVFKIKRVLKNHLG